MESRLKPNPIHWWLYTITAAVMLAGMFVAPRFLPIDNRPDVVKRHALLEDNCLGDPIDVPVPSRIYAINYPQLLTLPDAQVHKRYGIVVSNELSHILCENDLNALLAKHKHLSIPNLAECKKEDSCMYQYQYDPRLLFADAGLINMTTLPYSFQSPAFKKYLLQPNHSSPDSSTHKKTQTSRQEPFFMIPAGILVAPNLPFIPVSEISKEAKKSCWNWKIPLSTYSPTAHSYNDDNKLITTNRTITVTVPVSDYTNTAPEKRSDFTGLSSKAILPVSENCALLIPRRPNQGIVISTPDN